MHEKSIAQPTPGPWSVATYTGHTPPKNGDWVGEITSDTEKVYRGAFCFHAIPKEANARLIAAAPELLAACERIIQEAERDCIDDSEWSDGERMARAAIAKARGQS